MKTLLPLALIIALLPPPLPAQESDPLVDMLNNRNFDRDAIMRQFENISVTVSPPEDHSQQPAQNAPATDTDSNTNSDGAPAFRPLIPQLPPGAANKKPIEALALVLPLNSSGTTAAAAGTFRQGCVDALNAVGAPVRVDSYAHDGGSMQAITAYQNAVEEGALFVIGPMQKNNVRALQQAYPQAPVKTLLLQPPENNTDSSYYALTIDLGEEAAELARLLQEQNYRVLIVADSSAVSRRQQSAFARTWAAGSRLPPDYFYVYDPERDWQKLFNQLKDQKQEQEQLQEDIPPLVIFAAGNGDFIRRARNFIPQCYPLYASSVFFSVTDNAKFLDNLRIMEMPWFVAANTEHIRSFASPLIRTRPVLQQRFYALGADACRIAQQSLLWHEGWKMQGASGSIELVAGIFRRRGVLSQYESGYLKPLTQ